MDHMKSVPWGQCYQEALLERDPHELFDRVLKAEGAIFSRMQDLASGTDDKNEWQAIQEACEGLYRIKKEKLRWPVA